MLYAKDNGLASTNNDRPPIQLHPRATEQACCLAEDSKYSEHTQPEPKLINHMVQSTVTRKFK